MPSKIRTRWIGANPKKSDLVNSGVRTKENLVNSVFCCFSWDKSTKCSQNPGLVNEFSATPRGQLYWTGPIANSSDKNPSKKALPLKNLLRTLLRSVQLHDPLGVSLQSPWSHKQTRVSKRAPPEFRSPTSAKSKRGRREGDGKKKRHDNLRQTSRQFTTFYDNLRHFMTISVSLFHGHKTS